MNSDGTDSPTEAASVGDLTLSCLPLHVQHERFGTLRLYAGHAHAFEPHHEKLAALFATHPALALAEAQRPDSIRADLQPRQLIGQASVILMERHRSTATSAFQKLIGASQATNRKLVAVAEHFIETGDLPDRTTHLYRAPLGEIRIQGRPPSLIGPSGRVEFDLVGASQQVATVPKRFERLESMWLALLFSVVLLASPIALISHLAGRSGVRLSGPHQDEIRYDVSYLRLDEMAGVIARHSGLALDRLAGISSAPYSKRAGAASFGAENPAALVDVWDASTD